MDFQIDRTDLMLLKLCQETFQKPVSSYVEMMSILDQMFKSNNLELPPEPLVLVQSSGFDWHIPKFMLNNIHTNCGYRVLYYDGSYMIHIARMDDDRKLEDRTYCHRHTLAKCSPYLKPVTRLLKTKFGSVEINESALEDLRSTHRDMYDEVLEQITHPDYPQNIGVLT